MREGTTQRAWAPPMSWRAVKILALSIAVLLPAVASAAGPLPWEVSSVEGVDRPETLGDGVAIDDGGHWDTDRSAVFGGRNSRVVLDLGEISEIAAVWLQADNNDSYVLEVSDDGVHFRPLWTAGSVRRPGMQPRFTDGLDARGRYVSLSPGAGDTAFSVSEVQLFSELPDPFPPIVSRRPGRPAEKRLPAEEQLRANLLSFGLALLLGVAVARRGRWIRSSITLVIAGLTAWRFYESVMLSFPVSASGVSFMRGTIALLAAAIVLWETFSPREMRPDRHAVLAALGVCGLLGVLTFYNVGQPQFHRQQSSETSFVHYLDLRQYHPTAKYFPELGYFRIYEADVSAYAEDRNLSLDQLASLPLRDLYTNHSSTVSERKQAILETRMRFSDERWAEYVEDARYFRQTMGNAAWIKTMFDLGGNATPLWIAVAHLLFNAFDTNHESFVLLSLVDPLLFLLLFGTIARVFGLRTTFVCMVIFGANDFIMFGTNWGGAVLRHDWLVLLGLGACALKRERWTLAGICFGLATAIRAFPALAIVGLTLPALWWFAEEWRNSGLRPSLRAWIAGQRPVFITGATAVATVLVAVVVSSIVLSPSAWPEWSEKVSLLGEEDHINPISLRTVLAGNTADREQRLDARFLAHAASVIAYLGLIAVAARRRRLEQAAMLGLILLPVLLYPANYYMHIVCLLPLVAVDRHARGDPGDGNRPLSPSDAWVWFSLLGICGAQYFATLGGNREMRFYLSAVLLMTGLAAMLVAMVRPAGQELLALLRRRPRRLAEND